MKLFLTALLLSHFPLFAETAVQTDWSGGPGVLGPVVAFGNTFLSDSGICITTPGQITLDPEALTQQIACWIDNREPCGYPETGFLESSIFDSQDVEPFWGLLFWSYEAPSGTSIGVQVRASDDYSQMGPWSEVFSSSPVSLIGVLDYAASYVQYRVTLSTLDPDATPTLKDIVIIWPIDGVGEWDPPASCELLPISPNPSAGSAEAIIGLSSSTSVEILVFDLTGRLVEGAGPADYQPGWHTVGLGEFAPGIYFVRMQAGEFAATQRFVVIE
jgi:hypothetical protein